MIALTDTSGLARLLGDKIVRIGSSALHVSGDVIESYEMNMLLTGNKNSIVFEGGPGFGFFENDDGDVFYDYKVATDVENTSLNKSTVRLRTSEIIQIDIYGRIINAEEFKPYADVYKMVKGKKRTDDLFSFLVRKEKSSYWYFIRICPDLHCILSQIA